MYKDYKKNYEQYLCNHCWVWTEKFLDWKTDDGTVFKGTYLCMTCGHCQKQGKILMKYNEKLHGHIPSGSRKGFADVHGRGPCPAKGLKMKPPVEVDYADDF